MNGMPAFARLRKCRDARRQVVGFRFRSAPRALPFGRLPSIRTQARPAFAETANCALECVLARIRLGVSCLEGTPSLDRLQQNSASLDSPKPAEYQGKIGATGFEPATFRPPAECAISVYVVC